MYMLVKRMIFSEEHVNILAQHLMGVYGKAKMAKVDSISVKQDIYSR